MEAIESMNAGDIGSIFTPDDTHFEIAKAAIKKGFIISNIIIYILLVNN